MERIQDKIAAAVEALPEDKQEEVLDFAEFLRERLEPRTGDGAPPETLDPADNPLRDLIGSVDHDLGSDQIDNLLYGT